LQYAMSGGYYAPSSSGSYSPQAPATTSPGNGSDGFSQVPDSGKTP
jgi:hypothetical protein